VSGSSPAARTTAAGDPLRVALLSYRSKPHCGGQGVYVRNLSRELAALGHDVEVLSGQPYPTLDPGVRLTKLPSLDLYREPDPFRTPGLRELRDPIDLLEVATMWTAGFPEPLTFSLRALRHLRGRAHEFDLVHDNQSLGYGVLGIKRLGLPVLATVHHPITIDLAVELEQAAFWRRVSLRRWYGFARMQARVTRALPRVVTVSEASKGDILRDFQVAPGRVRTIPVGVDPELFRPPAPGSRVPGRIVTTASADVPLKGVVPLLEAVAKVCTERDAHLVVVGTPKPRGVVARTVDRLGLGDRVEFVSGLSDEALAGLLASAEVAVVPSLYEGFSLPAVESMACATPLVATTGGALPEVAGRDGETALLVPPGDPGRLATAMGRLLDDPQLRKRLGEAGRRRVLERFTWSATAAATAEVYREMLAVRRARTRR
jgi:glycosyltransferase involved in cell wall biosynthesis